LWRILRATRESVAVRVVGMVLAQIGPLTTVLETAAASVGAGSFSVVSRSVLAGLRRDGRGAVSSAARLPGDAPGEKHPQ
jgi:hypothetical protein